MSLSVDRVAKPGCLFERRGTIGRPALEPQDTAFRASLAVVGFGSGNAGDCCAVEREQAPSPRGGARPEDCVLAVSAAMWLGLFILHRDNGTNQIGRAHV